MTLDELEQERASLIRQRLERLRGSNKYKRISKQLTQIESHITALRREAKLHDEVELKAKIENWIGKNGA
jgi:hypothetical protein